MPIKEVSKRKTNELESSSSTTTDSSDSDNEIKKSKNKKETLSKKLKSSDNQSKAISSKSVSETTEDGNMILLKGDDSLWKNTPDKASHSVLVDEKKSRETEFEDYLEDLLL